MTKQISVRRTGFVVFSFRIVSIFTGLAFLLMMTRTLSTAQFGLWEVVLDLVTFASYPAGLLVYWATRDIARGRMLGKTALGMNLALSALGMVLYVGFSYVTGGRVGQSDLMTFLLAIFLVPIAYWNQAGNAIVQGYDPIVQGYSTIASEIAKLAFAFPLLIVFHVGIDGVIVALMAANFTQAATSTFLARGALELPFDPAVGRRWIRRSWLPSLSTLPYVLGVADTFVATLAAGGTITVGYYQAAFAVASLAGYSFYLGAALYPLLLRGGAGSEELPTTILDLSLLFGIPMAVGAAALAKPILFVLSPRSLYYVESSTALMILAFAALVNATAMILDQVLAGRETIDADESAGFRHFVHSNLFFVFLVNIGNTAIYVSSVFAIVSLGTSSGAPASNTIDLWAAAQLIVFSTFVAARVVRIRKSGKLSLRPSFLKYVAGSAIMAVFFVVARGALDYASEGFEFTGELAVIGLIGVGIYFAFLFATERNFRRLVRVVLRPLIGRGATGAAAAPPGEL
jgi:O-antigen/teichoic acid export membrane protein